MEYYLVVKRKEALMHAVWRNLENTMRSKKKPVTKDYIVYNSIYVKYSE